MKIKTRDSDLTDTDDLGWFTVLDLKDAFFCIPVHKDSQEHFAFEWENPETGRRTQLTRTVLPQSYKNSLFGIQLVKKPEDWRRQQPERVVLQYADNILIAAKNQDQCIQLTENPENYRPVSLTSIPGKVMEQLILETISRHIKDKKIIIGSQHGFTKRKSCLINFCVEVTGLVDEWKAVDIVYVDFSKVIDTVLP
ncbi:hypothetical protein BTVI_119233 [Pitangus sulphuratus]|nr:hypothetical protein BTVI_119233 [Pitangus sulphuratus]